MATIRDTDNIPRRLVKLYLPVDTVRRVDAAILRSEGAFFDRAEFVNEALIDRLAEEGNGAVRPALPRQSRPAELLAVLEPPVAFVPELPETVGPFADWASRARVPTLPVTAGPGANFGLHNRDYPTIWACDLLGRLTVEAGRPIAWEAFSQKLLKESWGIGRRLAADDAESGRPVKAGVGFPSNAAKKDAAERRFLAHSFGLPNSRGNLGPVFVFRWVGIERDQGEPSIALTDAGRAFFRRLAKAGHPSPPFGESAWRMFADHLTEHARSELYAWLSVLELLREQPNRAELVERCSSWWQGTEAATNSMSYVSRGREWGLVEPRLRPDNRYALTERGAAELDRLKPVLTEGEAS